MPLPQLHPPIRILPGRLADQIAAGEVIERPASVLKELVENALDAAARRIDVELVGGGTEFLRVSDDGHGISGSEMPLAICRHATSKISRLDDLQSLQSLGFRGEALASICSVSQWEISSRRAGEASAYAMRAAGGAEPIPVNHSIGTTVVVRKLFFNTPARRKFLRAERTEFRHCDEVFRRLALARFDVAFYLKHNERVLQRLPAAVDDIGRSRRVAQLCGEAFLRQSLVIDYPRAQMRLWGWISGPGYSRQQSDMQYFYINGRIIRDRVISHALRLAYRELLPAGRHAAFVLHLELDPASVDVNVHPTKHEVRFHEGRLVHDFIRRCLKEALQQHRVPAAAGADRVADSASFYTGPAERDSSTAIGNIQPQPAQPFFGESRAVLLQRFVLSQAGDHWYLIDAVRALAGLSTREWRQACSTGVLKQRPLLIPQEVRFDHSRLSNIEEQLELLDGLGFDFTQRGPNQALLRAMPVYLQGYDAAVLLGALLNRPLERESLFATLEEILIAQGLDFTTLDINQLLLRLARQREDLAASWRRLEREDLLDWLMQRHPGND